MVVLAALATALLIVGGGLWLAMVAIRRPAQPGEITAGEFAAATLRLMLLGACLGGCAFAVGAASGRKAFAMGLTVGVTVLAYLANGVFPQLEGLEWTRDVSTRSCCSPPRRCSSHWAPGRSTDATSRSERAPTATGNALCQMAEGGQRNLPIDGCRGCTRSTDLGGQ